VNADVTLCIPAWQAEAFIDRTLACARAQTHAALRILVSIDRSDDGTEAICRRHAAEDPRVDVVVQPHRLGWADNCNELLDRVDSDFFAFYFHDDAIAPDYVQRLRAALVAEPEAVAAYCDVRLVGDADDIIIGRPYAGRAAERVLLAMSPARGAPLRALTRRAPLQAGLRFPALVGDGFWRGHPYLLALVAAGPVLHVPEVLYERWIRADGLTAGWNVQDPATLRAGVAGSAQGCLPLFDRIAADADEHALLRACLVQLMLSNARPVEFAHDAPALLAAADLGAAFADLPPPAPERLPPALRAGYAQLADRLHEYARAHAERWPR
jgi:hypothetical protein